MRQGAGTHGQRLRIGGEVIRPTKTKVVGKYTDAFAYPILPGTVPIKPQIIATCRRNALRHQRLLFRERYVLAGRAEHPALRPGLSLETFCQLEHVIVSPDGGGFSAATDTALANLGLTRRVVLSVPHFLFMLETLRNSDLVAVLPERLVRGQSGLVVVEPPLAVAGFDMLMLWHERWHRDPAHQWLRQFIVNSLEEQTC